jgi:23S rRNA (guanosine2251-2'-O)-methyltransferase
MRSHSPRPSDSSASAARYWMVGWHAVLAALDNPEREISRLVVSRASADSLPKFERKLTPEIIEGKEIEKLAGGDAVHQGIAALVKPLARDAIDPVLTTTGPLVILDQVTDPHNIGAILRSCAAFGASALILTRDHSARETAAMAKAASGALDLLPIVEVTNLAQGLKEIKDAGFWVLGLDGAGKRALHEVDLRGKFALILGAEGKGMRRLTSENCDEVVRLPMAPAMESLNVSNAAAIALYQLYIGRK